MSVDTRIRDSFAAQTMMDTIGAQIEETSYGVLRARDNGFVGRVE